MDQQLQQQYLSQQMPDINPYIQQSSFAPSAFMHRDSFDAMDESSDNRSLPSLPVDQDSIVSSSTDHSNGLSYAQGEKYVLASENSS
jgi:hypothetical protein